MMMMRCRRSNPTLAFDPILSPTIECDVIFQAFFFCLSLITLVHRDWTVLFTFLFLYPLSSSTRFSSPLSSCFSFQPFVFAADEKIAGRKRTSAHDLHNVPVIWLISGLPTSASSRRLMSCAWHSWLVWLPFVCLCFYYLAVADRFYLERFCFFILLLWLTLVRHQSYGSRPIVKALHRTAWALC